MNYCRKTILFISFIYLSHALYCQNMSFGYVSSISVPGYSGSGWDSFLAENEAEDNPIIGIGWSSGQPSSFSIRVHPGWSCF